MERGFYQRFKQEFLDGLRQSLPLDGLYLPMHGAVSVEGMQDAEGDLLSAARAVVGQDCFIAASYDLHGNVSQQVMPLRRLPLRLPHRPACRLVPRHRNGCMPSCCTACASTSAPARRYIPVPILLPGEQTSTEWEPAASLYSRIPEVIDGTAVMDASILIGYVWADEPRSSASVLAYGRDALKTLQAAQDLAQRFWDARGQFQFGVPALGVDALHPRRGRVGCLPGADQRLGRQPHRGRRGRYAHRPRAPAGARRA